MYISGKYCIHKVYGKREQKKDNCMKQEEEMMSKNTITPGKSP